MAAGARDRPYSRPMTPKFRMIALAESLTYLALLAAVVVKRGMDGPDAVSVLGPIHGIIFLGYFVLTLLVREEQGWTGWQTVTVLIAAALPFGGFVVNNRMVHDVAPMGTV